VKTLKYISILLGIILISGAVSFTMDVLNSTGSIGATLTTISSTDNVADFPTTYNANLSELDASKFELSNWFSTTTAPQITTLSNLATVGTITSGTWQGTDIGVAHGGTGSSTPTGLLYGDGAGNLDTIPYGNSGQFLQSQGAGTSPQYASSTIDQSQDFDWTGLHTFSGGLLSTASSTFSSNVQFTATTTIDASNPLSSALQLNGISYAFPSAQGASSTVLMTDGAGNLTWDEKSESAGTTVPCHVGNCSIGSTDKLNNQVSSAFSLNYRIVIDKISVNVTAVGSAGTANFAIYSEDGQTQHWSTTTSSISSTGNYEMDVSDFTLDPGVYYFAHSKSDAGTDVTFSAYDSLPGEMYEGGTGASHLQGRFGNGNGALPATFDPTSDLSGDGNMIVFRIN